MEPKEYEDIHNFLSNGVYPPAVSSTSKTKWNFRRKISLYSVEESDKLFKVILYSKMLSYVRSFIMYSVVHTCFKLAF